MTSFAMLVAVAVVAALAWAVLKTAKRQGLNLWRRRRPFRIQVQHLPHALMEDADQQTPVALKAEMRLIVREPWAVALDGPLPDSRHFEATQPLPAQAHAWLRSHGAVDYRETKVRLALTSNTDEPILIRNIRVDVQRRQPLAGTYVYCPTAGAISATLLVFELDEHSPQARQWAEDGFRRKVGFFPYFAHHSVAIKRDETCDFVIIGSAKTCFARWRLVVDYEIGGHQKTLYVDDGDDWFKTSGEPASGFATRLHWAWYADGHFLPEPEDA